MKPIETTDRDSQRRAKSFDQLFDRYAPRVMGYLLRLTGNRSEAEDLTQETFLAAFQGQDRFAGKAQMLTWLFGIARRRLHERGKRAQPVTEPLNEETTGTGDHAGQVAVAATLSAALAKLDEAEREVILLTAVQGLTMREAAEVLGEPVGTVKWRAHEATKQLRAMLNAADERYEARYGTRQDERGNEGTERNTTRFAARPNR